LHSIARAFYDNDLVLGGNSLDQATTAAAGLVAFPRPRRFPALRRCWKR